MRLGLWEMTWGRRLLLFAAAGLFAVLLSLALSVALARPAGASTLPSLPVPVSFPAVPVSVPAVPTQVLPVATSAASAIVPADLPTSPLPVSQLPVSPLPVSQLPTPPLPISSLPLPLPILSAITKSATETLTTGANPTATTTGGLLPGTGGPAHESMGKLSGPLSRRLGSPTDGSTDTSAADSTGSPRRTPTRPAPSPSLPALPANAGNLTVPGHGSNPWNVLPLTILLLTVLLLGGVTFKRRLFLKLLFDSRFAPPG